jgi:hypothetical protein
LESQIGLLYEISNFWKIKKHVIAHFKISKKLRKFLIEFLIIKNLTMQFKV